MHDRKPAVGGDAANELERGAELLGGGRQLVGLERRQPADLARDRAQVADRLDDVAGAGLALGADHRRALADPAQRLAEVGRAAHERHLERPLVDVVGLVGGRQHLGLVDVVDLERLEHLRLGEVADPRLRHHRDRDRLLDALDHLRVGHPRDAAVAADVGGHALERHHRAGAGVLGDLRLLGRDDVHDHAALEHLGQTGLDREGRLVARGVAVARHRSRVLAGAVRVSARCRRWRSTRNATDDCSPTELARGPWDPGAQHGGAPAAMLVRAFEHAVADDRARARARHLRVLRPVPLGELARADRAWCGPAGGCRLLEGSLRTADGVEVDARARRCGSRRRTSTPAQRRAPPPGPGARARQRLRQRRRDDVPRRRDRDPLRRGEPSTSSGRRRRGSACACPLIAGEEPSPLQRLAAAADFPNGIATTLSWDEYMFINPDLTLYIEREPVGEWICLDAHDARRAGGVGARRGASSTTSAAASGARCSRCWSPREQLGARGRRCYLRRKALIRTSCCCASRE